MSNPEISCDDCNAACCRGNPVLTMQLSLKEVKFMKKGGNRIQTIVEPAGHVQEKARYPIGANIDPIRRTVRWIYLKGKETEPLPAGMGRYALFGECQYLETDENGHEYCGVYDNRPQVCRDFEMGGDKCQTFREREGLGTPIEISRKPNPIT